MKFLSRLMAVTFAASLLSACSTGSNALLPQVSSTPNATHDGGSRHTMCVSDETICVKEPPDDNIGFNNCIIGCYGATPTGGGYVGPWGAGGGSGCLQDPSSCLAYPGGKAEPGKTCGAGGTVLGPSVGQVLDNSADTPPGTNPSASNEVNNNFYLTAGTGYGTSATTNTVFGIVSTTFNGEVWFTPELSLPLYGGEISIRIGTGITSAKTVSASQTAQWIQNWINTNPSAPSAVKAGLQAVEAGLNSMGGSLNQNECYSGGSWNGTTTA